SEQAPGPRGSPQVLHGPISPLNSPSLLATEKTDSCFSISSLWQLGHATRLVVTTIFSNLSPHCRQTYSKMGIVSSHLL
ncbi:hypothetical protein WAJ14_19945, partial [Acinetobacter baumannii]